MTDTPGYQAEAADLTLTINRSNLEETLSGEKSFEDHMKSGSAQLEGNPAILKEIGGMLAAFDPTFEVFPGTRGEPSLPEEHDPFDATELKGAVPE